MNGCTKPWVIYMKRYALVAGFAATVPAANWLMANIGTVCGPNGPCLVPVGFGLMAPSGVMVIGLALVMRDAIQEQCGRKWALIAVAVGCALSLLTSPPALAVASAVAFALAEIADYVVYSRLRAKGRPAAILLSGAVGAVMDSAVFVYLAFGSFDLSAGTTLAKLYASAAVAVWLRRRG